MPQGSVLSPHVVSRSNWLEGNQEVDDLLNSNLNDLRSGWIGVEDDEVANEVFDKYRIPSSQGRVVQAYFHLFMNDLPHPFELTKEQKKFNNPGKPFEYTGDPNGELDEMLRRDIQPVEESVLACLFLNKDQIPNKFRYIHDLIHRTPIERFNRSYVLPDHGEIPLPDQVKEVSSLGLERGTATIEDLRTLRTRSYYHIDKDELMDRVRDVFRNFFNDKEVRTYEDVRELYDKLLDYRGATMGEVASNQFPNDEVIFLGNRSMTSQSIERAGHLPTMSGRIDDSTSYFKVTHHGMVKDGNRLIPTMNVEVWTNDQLRDVLGYDGMFDPRLTLEDNGMDSGRNIDHQVIRRIVTFANEVSATFPADENYQGGFLIKTDSDRLFLESKENLLRYMVRPKEGIFYLRESDSLHYSGSSLRNDSDEQPTDLSGEYCFYNGSVLRDFTLVNGNLFKGFDGEDFSSGECKFKENLFYNTLDLQGAYMLNLFFHQNRLDGLYSWYQDIYLANVRYLREHLRSVNLNEEYQATDYNELILSNEGQLYMRNSNVFVDTFVRTFGNFSYPFVELNDLNNVKLLRLSLMANMNYLCFLAQSHFLRSMVDAEFESKPNLLKCVSEKSILLDNLIVPKAQLDGVTSYQLKFSLEDTVASNLCIPGLDSKSLRTIREYFSGNQKNLIRRAICIDKDKFNLSDSQDKNLGLDYLTLIRFLQDDSSYDDELSGMGGIDSHSDNKHVVPTQEQLNRLMFDDANCQIHSQDELDSIPKRCKQDLLDEGYLNSENRKVNPNLHNRELRSLLPVFLISQVLADDEPNLDFLPTITQLDDPVRFVSSLELANSFFDDYYSRKTWNDENVHMMERMLLELKGDNPSEEVNNEFLTYFFELGNCGGMIDLLLLLNVTKTSFRSRNNNDIYLKINDCGVFTLNLKREILNSFTKIRYNNEKISLNLLSFVRKFLDLSGDLSVDSCLKVLSNLRTIEQYAEDMSSCVKQVIEANAPFLRESGREVQDAVDLKLLYLDDSVIRNIFVRNHMLNRLARVYARDEPSLILPSLNVEMDREAIEQAIHDYVLGLSTDSTQVQTYNRAGGNPALHLESDYLSQLLTQGVNSRIPWNSNTFLRRLKNLNRELSVTQESRLLPNVLSNRHVDTMVNHHGNLIDGDSLLSLLQVRTGDNVLNRGVNSEIPTRLTTLTSKRKYLTLLLSQGGSFYGMDLPNMMNREDQGTEQGREMVQVVVEEQEVSRRSTLRDLFSDLWEDSDVSDHDVAAYVS